MGNNTHSADGGESLLSLHVHHHGAALDGPEQRRALLIALGITALLIFAEIAGSIAFNSLALAADAAHLVSDTFALGLALAAQVIATRPASPRHSFGWRRIEVMAAQVNGILLVLVSVWIAYEAISRFGRPEPVNGAGLMVIAVVGLLANSVSTLVLRRAPGESMNLRAAALHTLSDAAGSVGVLFAGAASYFWEATWADPLASIFIALMVIVAAVSLLRDTAQVLLEGSPRHLDPALVEAALVDDDAVLAVHHLHLWTISSDNVALSAHIELVGPATLHDAQSESMRLKHMLAESFGVRHSTLELECHPCDPKEQLH